jgi:hypothetical protein
MDAGIDNYISLLFNDAENKDLLFDLQSIKLFSVYPEVFNKYKSNIESEIL